MVLRFVSSQRFAYLVFRWKANQLKASEGDNKICIHVLWVVFDRATFAFRRKHVSFTYFAFVTVTWLSIVHSSKTIYHVSLYSEKERRFGKSGNLCTQRSKLASRTCGERSLKKQGAGHFFNLCTDCYRSKTASSSSWIGATWCVGIFWFIIILVVFLFARIWSHLDS